MVVRHRQVRDCYQEKLLLVQVRVEFQGATEKKVPVQVRSVGTWAVLTETIRQSGRNERPTTILAAAGLPANSTTTDNSIGRVIVCLVDLRLHRPDLLQLGGRRRRGVGRRQSVGRSLSSRLPNC